MAGEALLQTGFGHGICPHITPVAALNRLSAWIHHHKPLYQALLDRDMRTDSVFSIRYKWG